MRTTTTYAILGLLAAEPASAYALAERMRITYGYFWPRARSHVFTEVKKLEALGWVEGRAQWTGRRSRTEFAVTTEGSAALAAWLDTPPSTFALEMEGLVRLYLAPFGRTEALAVALATVEDEADRMLEIGRSVVPAYLRGEGPPPADDLASRALLIDFLVRYAALVKEWAAASREEVCRWPGGEREDRARSRLLTLLPLLHAGEHAGPQAAPAGPMEPAPSEKEPRARRRGGRARRHT